ncbi:helix-turn-helix domain-containing protein [Brachybacterium alimentarium]|uniref:helix-turn-helix domain-containing protein n=1 Tax=Brachybacterium alimentarium TaxID=47845 RepID=UPI003FD1CA4E
MIDQERTPSGAQDVTALFNARFGARVKTLRESHQPYLSQEAAAHRAGVAVSTWSRVERGLQAVHPQRLLGIAEALDVEIGELFVGLDG